MWWIFHVFGRQSGYVIMDKTFMMVKGSSHLGVNFGLIMDHLRFLASNQTLSPLTKEVNPWLLCEDIT